MSSGPALGSHNRQASSSSYAPILINPTPLPPHSHPSQSRPRAQTPTLTRAWPLIVLAALDAAYTLAHAQALAQSHGAYFGLCITRAVVLVFGVGLSKDWRSRGGWVAVISGLSVGYAVWTLCKAQLERGRPIPGGAHPTQGLPALFLGITAGLSALEYILHVLLLRLSPPHHRSNPLSMRLPHSAVQSPTPFAYNAENLSDEHVGSPLRPRTARAGVTKHRRNSSRHTLLRTGSLTMSHMLARGARGSDTSASGSEVEGAGEDEDEDTFGPEEPYDRDLELGDEDLDSDDFSDSSTISESSIIDLPPPLSPSRIVPPPSLSVNRGLDILAGIEQTPVVGAVVRRTRSARVLGRSWGSRTGEEGEGYGTFGAAQGQGQGLQQRP